MNGRMYPDSWESRACLRPEAPAVMGGASPSRSSRVKRGLGGLVLVAAVALAATLARAAERNVGLLADNGGTASCEGCYVGQAAWDTPYCHGPEALFDGLVDRWVGCTYSLRVTRSWPLAVSVSGVRFLARGGMVWPPRYALYASDDGSSWALLAQGAALQNQWTTVALPRFTARHLKLWLASSDNLIYAGEVEVWGGPACAAAAGCATVTATVGEELSLSLSAAAVSFGAVAPSGSPYAAPAALAFTVRSNVPWDVLASASAPRLADGTAELPATEYREGSAEFVPFPAQPAAIASGQPTAGETHVHDYRQRVPFTAPPGRYTGSVTYNVLAR